MNLADLLPRGERAAIVDGRGRTITFDALADAGEKLARGLRARLPPESRVFLLLPVGVDLYVALVALLRARMAGVVVDPGMGLGRARACVAPLGLAGMLASPAVHLARLVAPELRGLALYAAPGWAPATARLQALDGPALGQEPCPADTPALLTSTTGTTGRPKAVLRTHGLLDAQRAALHRHMGVGPGDVALETLPVFALSSMAAGATVVFPEGNLRRPGRVDPGRAVARMRRFGVTVGTASPAFWAPIARWLRARGETYPAMRALWTGGARVPAALLRELCVAFPEARVEVVYGSTEAEPIAAIDARAHLDEIDAGEADGRGALVGAPVPEVDVRVVDGEVQVAGAHVNPRYFEDPEADAKHKVRDGARVWHRTGDLARVDPAGRLWLLGRVGDQVGGLLPFPVEAAAERVPGVARAALLERDGAPLLCVQGDGELDAVRLATGVQAVRRVPRVPVDRRHDAKVDRAALRRLID